MSTGVASPEYRFRQIYRTLLDHYGPQHWWPGDTAFEMMVGAILTQNTAWRNVETADAILLYAFQRPVFVIDAYTRRIFSRFGLVSGNESYERLRARFEGALDASAAIYNEYHALIVQHAKQVCRVKPECGRCTLCPDCGYATK